MGHLLSQREAARKWGVGRTTLQKSITSGKLSLTASKLIDPAEMLRVFGEPKRATNPASGPDSRPDLSPGKATPLASDSDPGHAARVAVLEAELSGLRATLSAKNAHIEDLRGQVRLLTHDSAGVAPKRRWWWQRT